jgi:predicted regulator of Ras-like GTPase activity (Roadblock/LC7/MglB family)
MSFQETLRETVERVDGAIGGIIIASDGIPVDQFMKEPGVDHNDLAAEASSLFKNLQQTTEDLSLGALKEVTFQTEKYAFVFRAITEDYFLALVLKSNSNFGKARFVLRTLVPKIENEF